MSAHPFHANVEAANDPHGCPSRAERIGGVLLAIAIGLGLFFALGRWLGVL